MEGRLLDRPLNPSKLLKEQFVSNLTGSSLLEIAALSTIVPAFVVLRKWSSGDNTRMDSAKKNDDVRPVRKDWMHYFSALVVDYLTVVLPILLVFTVLAEWAFTCAVCLVILLSIYIVLKRPQSHLKSGHNQLPSLRADISSYRVSVVLVTCLCILAVDFKIFPRRYAKAETYGSGIMDLGVGSFVVANALVARQARKITSMRIRAVLSSTSPLVFLGFTRIISTSGVDYQVLFNNTGSRVIGCQLAWRSSYRRIRCSLELLFYPRSNIYPYIRCQDSSKILWLSWSAYPCRIPDMAVFWIE